MGSLVQLATKLEEKKIAASKVKRLSLRELKKAQSLHKRSASGLVSVEKKLESTRENLSDLQEVLTQKTAQQESVIRLLGAAEERLRREKEAKDQIEQEIEFADTEEEKQDAYSRLKSITDKINDLVLEIKERKKMAKKIAGVVDQYQSEQDKLSTKIQKHTKTKPTLKSLYKTSQEDAKRYEKSLTTSTKEVETAKNKLQKVLEKLAKITERKRKANAKKKLSQKKKTATKKTAKKSAKKTTKKVTKKATKTKKAAKKATKTKKATPKKQSKTKSTKTKKIQKKSAPKAKASKAKPSKKAAKAKPKTTKKTTKKQWQMKL